MRKSLHIYIRGLTLFPPHDVINRSLAIVVDVPIRLEYGYVTTYYDNLENTRRFDARLHNQRTEASKFGTQCNNA